MERLLRVFDRHMEDIKGAYTNYRRIIMLSVTVKIYDKFVIKRLNERRKERIAEEEGGFKSGVDYCDKT